MFSDQKRHRQTYHHPRPPDTLPPIPSNRSNGHAAELTRSGVPTTPRLRTAPRPPSSGGRLHQLEARLQATEQANSALLDEAIRLQNDVKVALELHQSDLTEARSERERMQNTIEASAHQLREQLEMLAQRQRQEAINKSNQKHGSTQAQSVIVSQFQQALSEQKVQQDTTIASMQQQLESQRIKNVELQQSQQRILSFMNDELSHLRRKCESLEHQSKTTDTQLTLLQPKEYPNNSPARVLEEVDTRCKNIVRQGLQAQATRFASIEAAINELHLSRNHTRTQNGVAAEDTVALRDVLLQRINEVDSRRDADKAGVFAIVEQVRSTVDALQSDLSSERDTRMATTSQLAQDLIVRIGQAEQGFTSQIMAVTTQTRTMFENQNSSLVQHADSMSSVMNAHRNSVDEKMATLKSEAQQLIRKVQLSNKELFMQLNNSAQVLEQELKAAKANLHHVLEAEILSRQKQAGVTQSSLYKLGGDLRQKIDSTNNMIERMAQFSTKAHENTKTTLNHVVHDTQEQVANLIKSQKTWLASLVQHISKFEQDVNSAIRILGGGQQESRQFVEQVVSSVQQQSILQLEQLEQLRMVPATIATIKEAERIVTQTQRNVAEMRTEVLRKINNSAQEQTHALENMKLMVATKADVTTVDRNTDDLALRLEQIARTKADESAVSETTEHLQSKIRDYERKTNSVENRLTTFLHTVAPDSPPTSPPLSPLTPPTITPPTVMPLLDSHVLADDVDNALLRPLSPIERFPLLTHDSSTLSAAKTTTTPSNPISPTTRQALLAAYSKDHDSDIIVGYRDNLTNDATNEDGCNQPPAPSTTNHVDIAIDELPFESISQDHHHMINPINPTPKDVSAPTTSVAHHLDDDDAIARQTDDNNNDNNDNNTDNNDNNNHEHDNDNDTAIPRRKWHKGPIDMDDGVHVPLSTHAKAGDNTGANTDTLIIVEDLNATNADDDGDDDGGDDGDDDDDGGGGDDNNGDEDGAEMLFSKLDGDGTLDATLTSDPDIEDTLKSAAEIEMDGDGGNRKSVFEDSDDEANYASDFEDEDDNLDQGSLVGGKESPKSTKQAQSSTHVEQPSARVQDSSTSDSPLESNEIGVKNDSTDSDSNTIGDNVEETTDKNNGVLHDDSENSNDLHPTNVQQSTTSGDTSNTSTTQIGQNDNNTNGEDNDQLHDDHTNKHNNNNNILSVHDDHAIDDSVDETNKLESHPLHKQGDADTDINTNHQDEIQAGEVMPTFGDEVSVTNEHDDTEHCREIEEINNSSENDSDNFARNRSYSNSGGRMSNLSRLETIQSVSEMESDSQVDEPSKLDDDDNNNDDDDDGNTNDTDDNNNADDDAANDNDNENDVNNNDDHDDDNTNDDDDNKDNDNSANNDADANNNGDSQVDEPSNLDGDDNINDDADDDNNNADDADNNNADDDDAANDHDNDNNEDDDGNSSNTNNDANENNSGNSNHKNNTATTSDNNTTATTNNNNTTTTTNNNNINDDDDDDDDDGDGNARQNSIGDKPKSEGSGTLSDDDTSVLDRTFEISKLVPPNNGDAD